MKRVLILLVLGLVAVVGCTRPAPPKRLPVTPQANWQPGDYTQSLTFAGRKRSYVVHLPPTIADGKSFALVLVLHGGGGNAENAAKMSGMSTVADQQDFIVVYPNGTGRLGEIVLTWNSGNCCGYALDQNIDDVAFIRMLIDQLIANYPIDPKRVYATGISNGGMMTYRLGCELSDKIAAIAPVSGAQNIDCKPTQPISVIAFHGTADQHVLYNGGVPTAALDPHPRTDMSVASAISFWTKLDGCTMTPQRQTTGKIVHDTYLNCSNRTAVELYTIIDGGHAWPGGKSYISGDTPTQEISASELMAAFFAQHSKP